MISDLFWKRAASDYQNEKAPGRDEPSKGPFRGDVDILILRR
jgi:hypothetical protein